MSLCAIGDTLSSRETETMFMVGNGAFAAGNLTYVVLFLAPPTSDPALILTRPVVFRLLLVPGIMATLFTLRAGNLQSPVPAYIPIILGIAIKVLALPDAGALYRVLSAAMIFIAADLIHVTEKLLLPANQTALELIPYMVCPLNWGAQVGFLDAYT